MKLILIAALTVIISTTLHAESRVESGHITSDAFAGNKIGVSATRAYKVYLPRGYDTENKRYPVIYYLHSFFEDGHTFFGTFGGKKHLDKAIENGMLHDVIVVAADFSTPRGGGFYITSPISGDWQSFIADDLVAEIDRNYRTIAKSAARGIFGQHAGGYGAIRIASQRPDIFGVVYAMHPVATGHGNILMQSRPDWDAFFSAKSLDDIERYGLNGIFTIIYQATLPNPERSPLYFDPPVKLVDNKLVIDPTLVEKLQEAFFLERQIGEFAENLRSLRAFKFDWGRHDANQDHVYSNQFYSRKLNEFGVPHEAEEYNGSWDDKLFQGGGRFETDVLPFFQRNISFENSN
jgi:hypothetical protein